MQPGAAEGEWEPVVQPGGGGNSSVSASPLSGGGGLGLDELQLFLQHVALMRELDDLKDKVCGGSAEVHLYLQDVNPASPLGVNPASPLGPISLWIPSTSPLSPPLPPQDEAAQRVSLMTLHSAKGLEFQNVFFVGFEDGLVPYFRQGNRRGIAEV